MSGNKEYASPLLKPIGHNESCVLSLSARVTGKCTAHGIWGEPKLFLPREEKFKKAEDSVNSFRKRKMKDN